jgi:hypothetical protein
MLAGEQVEELICLVAAMDRESVINSIKVFEASFPLDFSDEFLSEIPLDQLRHVFVALCLQQHHIPEKPTPVPAAA